MTKKHYVRIAELLSEHITIGNDWTALHTVRSLAWNMSLYFISENPRFDSHKFFTTLGINLCRRCGHSLPFEKEHIKHECQY